MAGTVCVKAKNVLGYKIINACDYDEKRDGPQLDQTSMAPKSEAWHEANKGEKKEKASPVDVEQKVRDKLKEATKEFVEATEETETLVGQGDNTKPALTKEEAESMSFAELKAFAKEHYGETGRSRAGLIRDLVRVGGIIEENAGDN